jgi:thiol-disulfide isomerase/thioredoxin
VARYRARPVPEAGTAPGAVEREPSGSRRTLWLGLAAVGVVAAVAFAATSRRRAAPPSASSSRSEVRVVEALPEPAWEAPAAPLAVPAAPDGRAEPAAEPAPATCPVDHASPSDAPRILITRDWQRGADGYARAEGERDSGAPMLVYFYTDWCGYCRRLDERLLSSADVERYLGERVAKVRVNPEEGSAERALSRQFGVKGYPTLFLMGLDGVRLPISPYRQGGDAELESPEEFTRSLKETVGRQGQMLAHNGAQRRMAGDAAGAIALLDKALAIDPDDAGTWVERGIARATGGEHDGALADLRRARDLDGGRLVVYEAIDFALGRQNRWAEAASCWSPLLEREPQLAAAYYRRGASFFRAGATTRALADAEMACTLGDARACEIRRKLKG